MKIFYGVQATGNGHITRARAIAPKLKQLGIDVTYLFTGRPREQLFEMDVFGDFEVRAGLTFETQAGQVRYIKTALHGHPIQFIRDVRELDLRGYDLVVSDFEPVTAWAARLQGIKTVGIGHQYAFGYDIPKAGADFMGVQVLKYFAPVSVGLGVHWHHFDCPILPPIIEVDLPAISMDPEKIIVYLPFEDIDYVVQLLARFRRYRFHVYSASQPDERNERPPNVQVEPLSRTAFQRDFADAGGVICNSGFELSSESLHLGKKLLVKPLHRQMEQLSNARALEQLQLGRVMHDLDLSMIKSWLEDCQPIHIRYPDVASKVAAWLAGGDLRVESSWISAIWDEVERRDH